MATKPRYAAMHSRETWEWRTPQAIYEALDAEFHFDFDPCPLGGSEDGRSTLFTPWEGRRIFVNPAYGPTIGQFMERALEADLAVFLVPSRTDTKWFHRWVIPHATEIRFVRGRLKFGDATASAPFPSVVIVFKRGHGGPPVVSEFKYQKEKTQ